MTAPISATPFARLHGAHPLLALATAALFSSGAQAIGCDELRSSIVEKMTRSGLPKVSIAIVDAGQPGNGRVMGTCENGTRKLVLAPEAGATPAPARKPPRKDDEVLVECFDGQRYTDGPCKH